MNPVVLPNMWGVHRSLAAVSVTKTSSSSVRPQWRATRQVSKSHAIILQLLSEIKINSHHHNKKTISLFYVVKYFIELPIKCTYLKKLVINMNNLNNL